MTPAGVVLFEHSMSSFSLACWCTSRLLYLTCFFFLFSFFLFSFFFLSGNTPFSHTSQNSIFTKLGQSDQDVDHYSGTNKDGVKGHVGVTRVKKEVKKGSIFTKKESTPTDYVALTRDLCIYISLNPSTKVMVLKKYQRSFGVTGVKSENVIHTV